MHPPPQATAIKAIERPHKNLWVYYLLACLIFPPAFPFLVLPAWFRYSTMRYRFDDEGISMKWGILFRREIIINYARIQDIHLRSNLVERRLGLSKILVQTASGNASAEMVIEGLTQFEEVRDFIYSQMRGIKDHHTTDQDSSSPHSHNELAAILREVATELRAIRQTLHDRNDPAS